MSDLTVLTVAENDPGLTEIMISSVLKFTDTCPEFIICDNTGGKNEKRILDTVDNSVDINIVRNAPKLSGGSNRHGEALWKILKMSKTKYTAIIENDVMVTRRDWNKMQPGCKIKASIKLPGLYHCCFLVFETELLKGMDFRPGKNDLERRTTTSFKPKRDVGWKLSGFVEDTNIDYVLFVDCKKGNGKYLDKTYQSDEFHNVTGECLAIHLGRGSNIGGKSLRKGFDTPIIQMNRWKKIAKQIISKG